MKKRNRISRKKKGVIDSKTYGLVLDLLAPNKPTDKSYPEKKS